MGDEASQYQTRPSLLLRIRDGSDHEAWSRFVETYGPLLYRWARWKGLQDADAHKVTQRVLLRVSRSIGAFEYDPERGRFRDWLGTITRHEIGNVLKQQSRQVASAPGGANRDGVLESIEAPEEETTWTEAFHARVCEKALEVIRAEFAAETWEAFERTWLHDDLPATVARELNRPVAWVYKAKCRALKRLESEVQQLAEDGILVHPAIGCADFALY